VEISSAEGTTSAAVRETDLLTRLKSLAARISYGFEAEL
jgi:hypothetical protein